MEKKSSESVERISAVATRTVELLRSVAEVMAELRRFARQLGVEGADSLPALGAVDALAEQVLTTINGLRGEVAQTAEQLNGRVDEVETAISETGEQVEAVGQRVQGTLTDVATSFAYGKEKYVSQTTELTYESGSHFSHTTSIMPATATHAGVMTAEHVQRLEAAETKAQEADTKAEAALTVLESVKPGCLMPEHADLLPLLPPKTIAENYPDVVAIVEPKEAWFAFGAVTSNTRSVDVLVKVEDGILRRSQLPEGKDGIYLYKMDEVKFMNLQGFKRVSSGIQLTEAQQTEWPAQKSPTIIDGFVNMEDITNMYHAFGNTGLVEARGDWSGLNEKCTVMEALFGTWKPTTTVRVLPEKIGTAKVVSMNAIFSATAKVARYPELDFASLVNYDQWQITAYQFPGDPVPDYYPGEVRARIRNFGAQPTAYNNACFNLLKNWNIDDVMYTFDEAAVYRQRTIGVRLHGHVIERLTDSQKARISAKNITIYRMDIFIIQ